MTEPAGNGDSSRMERRRRAHFVRRLAIIAISVAALVVLAAGGYTAWQMRQAASGKLPGVLVVIAESELEDGTKVAGAAAVIELSGSGATVRPVDTLGPADIPGTSYDRLRDALTLGGPELVARLAVGEDAPEDELGWLLLDEDAWSLLVDKKGGARIELSGSTTVFTGEKLFRFSEGAQTIAGEDAVALLRGSEKLSGKDKGASARMQLTEQIAAAVTGDPRGTAVLVDGGDAESSAEPEVLARFLTAAASR